MKEKTLRDQFLSREIDIFFRKLENIQCAHAAEKNMFLVMGGII